MSFWSWLGYSILFLLGGVYIGILITIDYFEDIKITENITQSQTEDGGYVNLEDWL